MLRPLLASASARCGIACAVAPGAAKEPNATVVVQDPFLDLRTRPGPRLSGRALGRRTRRYRAAAAAAHRLDQGAHRPRPRGLGAPRAARAHADAGRRRGAARGTDARVTHRASLGNRRSAPAISAAPTSVAVHGAYALTNNLLVARADVHAPARQLLQRLARHRRHRAHLRARMARVALPRHRRRRAYTISPKATLVQAEDRTDSTAYAGLGVRGFLTNRFLLQAEYRSYVVFTSRDDNEEIDAWTVASHTSSDRAGGLAAPASALARAQRPGPAQRRAATAGRRARGRSDATSSAAAIDTENFEAGAFVGTISIEDFGSSVVYGARIAYHFTEDLYAEATLGTSEAGKTSYEDLSGSAELLTDSERQFTYYDLVARLECPAGRSVLRRRARDAERRVPDARRRQHEFRRRRPFHRGARGGLARCWQPTGSPCTSTCATTCSTATCSAKTKMTQNLQARPRRHGVFLSGVTHACNASRLLLALLRAARRWPSSPAHRRHLPRRHRTSRCPRATAARCVSSDLKGQVVMINFWATWCGPCRQEMPLLEQLQDEIRTARLHAARRERRARQRGCRRMAQERAGALSRSCSTRRSAVATGFGVEGMPSTVFIDRDGNVRYVHRGYKPGDEAKYADMIRSLVKE